MKLQIKKQKNVFGDGYEYAVSIKGRTFSKKVTAFKTKAEALKYVKTYK